MRQPSDFSLTERELAELSAWAGDRAERAVRVRIVRDAAAGLSVSRSARELGVSRPTVTAWRQRYARLGIAGLEHRPRSGRPPRIDEADVVASTLAGPPPPLRHWSARALADHLGLSHTALGRVWQRWSAGPAAAGGPLLLPTDPPLACRRPELLAAWAEADGRAGVVLAESEPGVRQRTAAAAGEERQLRHTTLTMGLRAAQLRAERARDAGPAVEFVKAPEAFGDREVRVILWGRHVNTDTHRLPRGAAQHMAHQAMSWPSTVSVLAQLELRHQPHRARGALDSLTEAARVHAGESADEPFTWLRAADATAEPRPARTAHRAFDQLALGSFNEKLVIECIRVAGALSRVEIADRTGLTPQAVSRITRNLLTTGFLTEDERRSAGKGKPRVPLRLRADAACAIGIHVDPEMITQVLVDLCGTVRDRRQLPLGAPSEPAWCVEQMARMAAEATRAVGPLAENLLGAGVAAPGPLDVGAGLLLAPPLLEGWGEVALRADLTSALGMPVLLEKDATAAAVGERWLGAADSAGDFVYLYLGAGAGSGAFLNGDVFRGSSGNAGEFGELTAYALGRLTPEGGPQMVPECAPMSAVVAKAADAGLDVPAEGAHAAVCAAAARGDERAAGAVRDVARVVARGAVGMTDLYDTDLLIVGGPAVPPEVAELYLSEISSAVNRFPMARRVRRVRVAYSTLGDAAAAVGAAAGVFHTTFAPRLRSHAGAGA
jgi:predicted NBD/HSP70 family sugar kinase/transposase